MMQQIRTQTERFGVNIRTGSATKADLSSYPFKITIDNKKIIETKALIIATGATAKYLGLPDEQKYAGSGVSACATCDGFFYKGKDVAVVGGGDTACEEAIYLSNICNKVYLIVRKKELRASKVMQQRVKNTQNIEILWEHQVKGLFGNNVVEGATLWFKKDTIEEKELTIKIDGIFLAIGHKPNSEIFADFLQTDSIGYIKTIPGSSKTIIPGVFACGDVQDSIYRQAITAAASGCMAAIDAERWLREQKNYFTHLFTL
jgi:thioredoxin reductase (NADPH)